MKEANPEQKIFDFVVANSREMIFNETGVKAVLAKMQAAEPAKAIGHTAGMILKSVQGGIKEQGLQIPPTVLSAAYKEVIGDLVELASVNGIIPEESKREVAIQAAQTGVEMLKNVKQAKAAQATQPAQPAQPMPPVSKGGLINETMGA